MRSARKLSGRSHGPGDRVGGGRVAGRKSGSVGIDCLLSRLGQDLNGYIADGETRSAAGAVGQNARYVRRSGRPPDRVVRSSRAFGG